jgi:hypothetical protein
VNDEDEDEEAFAKAVAMSLTDCNNSELKIASSYEPDKKEKEA